MTEPLTYVETTIPSFYHEARTPPDIVVRREWTRRWWDGARRPNGLVAYYMDLQKGYQDRLVQTEKATKHKSAA